jgi:hypothetical protein
VAESTSENAVIDAPPIQSHHERTAYHPTPAKRPHRQQTGEVWKIVLETSSMISSFPVGFVEASSLVRGTLSVT